MRKSIIALLILSKVNVLFLSKSTRSSGYWFCWLHWNLLLPITLSSILITLWSTVSRKLQIFFISRRIVFWKSYQLSISAWPGIGAWVSLFIRGVTCVSGIIIFFQCQNWWSHLSENWYGFLQRSQKPKTYNFHW